MQVRWQSGYPSQLKMWRRVASFFGVLPSDNDATVLILGNFSQGWSLCLTFLAFRKLRFGSADSFLSFPARAKLSLILIVFTRTKLEGCNVFRHVRETLSRFLSCMSSRSSKKRDASLMFPSISRSKR